MGHPRIRSAAALSAAMLLTTACGGSDLADQARQLAESAQEAGEQVEAAEADAAEEPDADDGDQTDQASASSGAIPAEVEALAGQIPDGVVYQRGFEFTVTGLSINDLDQQHADDTGIESDERVRGFELVVDLDVFNASPNPGGPAGLPASLRWTQAGSDNVVDLRGQMDVRDIPSLSSSSGQLTVPITPDDAAVLEPGSAALILGQHGQSAAVLPLGSESELVTRMPIVQTGINGASFDLGELQVTIEDATIWFENERGMALPDDEVLLELTYEVDGTAVEAQTCSTRGTGSWSLTTSDGAGFVDLGVSERCVTAGQSLSGILTGFILDADFAGNYTLSHERDGGGQDFAGELAITLEDLEGRTHAERNT
jgi:hypothetical protein